MFEAFQVLIFLSEFPFLYSIFYLVEEKLPELKDFSGN